MLAIVKSAEFYGPKKITQPLTDDRNSVVVYASRKAAQEAADAMEAADIKKYGCPMLDHNQASAWQYIVRRVPADRDIWHGAYLPVAA